MRYSERIKAAAAKNMPTPDDMDLTRGKPWVSSVRCDVLRMAIEDRRRRMAALEAQPTVAEVDPVTPPQVLEDGQPLDSTYDEEESGEQ